MNYAIRPMKRSEIPTLSLLLKTILHEAFTFYKQETRNVYERFFTEKELMKLSRKKKTVLLGAFDKEKLIGFCILVDKDGGVGFVEWLAISPEYRGKGIGPRLLKDIQKYALKKKFHYIFLYTETEKNIEFYKRQGFEYVGLQRNSWFGENEHLLQKILREEPFKEAFE